MLLRSPIVSFLVLISVAGCNEFGGEGEQIAESKIAVGFLLADPSSAQFSDVAVSGRATCGLVNAKNQFGAYSGLTGFIVDDGSAQLGDESSEFFDRFLKTCAEPAKSKFTALDSARTRHRIDAVTKALKE